MVPVSPFQLRIFHILRFYIQHQPLAPPEPAQHLFHHGDSMGTSQPKVFPVPDLPLLFPCPQPALGH